jgi:hypothetical protein
MDKSQITIDLINGIKENHKTAIAKCENDTQVLNVHISEQNVLLMDIACSLALIADKFNKEAEE